MQAMATKAARVSARFSKSFASPRLRPNHENVRSTQRRGRSLKPLAPSRANGRQLRPDGYERLDDAGGGTRFANTADLVGQHVAGGAGDELTATYSRS